MWDAADVNGTGLTVETHLADYSGNLRRRGLSTVHGRNWGGEEVWGAGGVEGQIAKDIARANEFFARLRKMRA